MKIYAQKDKYYHEDYEEAFDEDYQAWNIKEIPLDTQGVIHGEYIE